VVIPPDVPTAPTNAHAHPERHAHVAVVTRVAELQQARPRLDRPADVVPAGEAGREDRRDLVADQLLDQGVGVDQDGGRGAVEAIDHGGEVPRRQALGERRRPAYVDEQHRHVGLCATRILIPQQLAVVAEPGVERGRPDALHGAYQRAADTGEGNAAQLAPRIRRQEAQHLTVRPEVIAAFEDPPPFFGVRVAG
jgi:hypothetical protein